MLEALLVAGRHGGVKVDLLVFLLGLDLLAKGLLRREGLAHPGTPLAGLGLALGAGQHLGQQLVGQVGVAKKGFEQLAKHLPVLLAADQHRLHRSRQVRSVIQADRQCGLSRQCNARTVDPHPGAAQGATKGGQVGRQFAGARIAELHTSSGSGFGLGPQQVLGHVVGERRHIFALLEQNARRV